MTSRKNIPRQVWLKLGAGLLAANHLSGQTVLMTTPAPALHPLAMADDEKSNPMNVFLPSGTPEKPFKFGPFNFRPHASYNYTYSTGILAQPGNPQDTQVHTVSPGLTVDLGQHWVVDYTPTLRFYSSKEFNDGVDHAVSLTGGTHYQDWTLGLAQSFSYSTAPTAQTATQTRQQSYTTGLSANYAFGAKMSADFGLNQSLNFVSSQQDSRSWSTTDWLNYHFWERLNAGIGIGAGYVNVSDSGGGADNPDQAYEQLNARVNWRATDKVSFQITGGLEERQLLMAGAGTTLNPVFGVSVQYQPFKNTQLTLAANRTIGTSDFYTAAQTSETTSVRLNLSQRLLGEFNLDVGTAYNQTDYTQNGHSGGVNRTDDAYTVNVGLSRHFLKRGTWSLSYQYSDNRSSEAGYGYQSNQVGVSVSYAY